MYVGLDDLKDVSYIIFLRYHLWIQVIAFLYTAIRCANVGLKTALILTPVSVQHNWRHEFLKWRPSDLKPLRVFMLEDAPRFAFHFFFVWFY